MNFFLKNWEIRKKGFLWKIFLKFKQIFCDLGKMNIFMIKRSLESIFNIKDQDLANFGKSLETP